MKFFTAVLVLLLGSLIISGSALADATRHRVIVSTDIGGTDPDDFQSMVHLLLYADTLDIEGLISSPFGPGRKQHILEVIDAYARDYPNLRTYSEAYPSPETLRQLSKQGETEEAPYAGFRQATEGSEWIIQRARADDPRPLHVLIWGGIEDLAQALHDAPDILPRLRVYYIGGPNKKWGPHAYHFIATHFPTLWIIENNASYRGWFVGGDQTGDWGNKTFVSKFVDGGSHLGNYFATQLEGVIKMGDSPSVTWLLHGDPAQPEQASWGGQYVKAWPRPYYKFERLTTAADTVPEYSIVEWVLDSGSRELANAKAELHIENQQLIGYFNQNGQVRFRFSPKGAKLFHYIIKSNLASLDGKQGVMTALLTSADADKKPDTSRPHWWTDNPDLAFREGEFIGAKTVNRWRREFLGDFALRLQRAAQAMPGELQ